MILGGDSNSCSEDCFYATKILYKYEIPETLPTRLRYDITKTVPGGAIYHDYTLAFDINLKEYN